MSRAASRAALRQLRALSQPQGSLAASRCIGSKVPGEDWGQPASGGTTFLGTPANYSELVKSRPVSPDVFGLDGGVHYKFPPVALSSISTRVTGVVLSGGAPCAPGACATRVVLAALMSGWKQGLRQRTCSLWS